jgi:subtilisin family serine protease
MKSNYLSFFCSCALLLSLASGCTREEVLDVAPKEDLQADAANQRVAATGDSKVIIRKGNYIIISSGNTLPSNLDSQVKSIKGALTSSISKVGLATAVSTDPEFAAKAALIPGVRSVIPDFSVQWFDPSTERSIALEAHDNPASSGDDDRFFPILWGPKAIDAPKAWNAGYRGKGARVAVLDGGFDLDHPDLAANIDIAASKSFVPTEALQYNLPGVGSHGTHTAGTIAAVDNNIGVIGVAPEAQLILVKVLADGGRGNFSWMLQGIVHATDQGADVINMSLGAAFLRNGKFVNDNGTPDDKTDDFIDSDTKATQELIVAIGKATAYAYQNGVTILASAGNDANNGDKDQSLVHMPSDAPHVLSISATAPRGWALDPLKANYDFPASYTNFGTSVIDLAAPGGDYVHPGNEIVTIAGVTQYAYVLDYVLSTGNGTSLTGNYYWSVGTSMASPHAAGVAALIIGKNGGNMKPSQVEAVLRASADDLGKTGKDPYYGQGRVNAYRAVMSTNQ